MPATPPHNPDIGSAGQSSTSFFGSFLKAQIAGGKTLSAMLLAISVLSLICFFALPEFWAQFPVDLNNSSTEDLPAFTTAAQMALNGNLANAYDPSIFADQLPEKFNGLLWLNPPHAALVFLPFTIDHYGVAKAAWMLISVAMTLFVAVSISRSREAADGGVGGWNSAPARLAVVLAIFGTSGAIINLIILQLGAFMLIVLVGGLMASRNRPALAGFLFALATIKPQYGLMIPVFLLATGNYRCIAWTIAFTAGLVLASLVAWGLAPWTAFIDAMTNTHAAHAARLHEGAASFHQWLGKFGAPDFVRSLGQMIAMLFSAACIWTAARRLDWLTAIGATLIFSLFAAPSVWIYDWTVLTVGLVLFYRNQVISVWQQALLGIAIAAPLFVIAMEGGIINVVAGTGLLQCALISALAIARLLRRDNSAQNEGAGSIA